MRGRAEGPLELRLMHVGSKMMNGFPISVAPEHEARASASLGRSRLASSSNRGTTMGMMKLVDKGRFAVRPSLEGPAESVARNVETWPAVHARTHWQLGDETVVDGADFYVGERELGHLHLYPEAHIAMPSALRDAVIAADLARPFRWSESFVVHRVKTAAEARAAEWLFRLAYDRLQGVSLAALQERIDARATRRRPDLRCGSYERSRARRSAT